MPRDEASEIIHKQQFSDDFSDDAIDVVLQRLSALKGLENLQDTILDEVVDTLAPYADYYHVGAGVPLGMVSNTYTTAQYFLSFT